MTQSKDRTTPSKDIQSLPFHWRQVLFNGFKTVTPSVRSLWITENKHQAPIKFFWKCKYQAKFARTISNCQKHIKYKYTNKLNREFRGMI